MYNVSGHGHSTRGSLIDAAIGNGRLFDNPPYLVHAQKIKSGSCEIEVEVYVESHLSSPRGIHTCVAGAMGTY